MYNDMMMAMLSVQYVEDWSWSCSGAGGIY